MWLIKEYKLGCGTDRGHYGRSMEHKVGDKNYNDVVSGSNRLIIGESMRDVSSGK